MQKVFITNNSSQTKKLGKDLAKEILKTELKKTAFVLGLKGDLGGGKTTFLQGFAKGLGIKEKVLSPTFVLMKKFQIPPCQSKHGTGQANSELQNFYHIDCYRIQKSKEILGLGLKKMIFDPFDIIAIEWADRIKKILPKSAIWIKFRFIGKNKREILIKK